MAENQMIKIEFDFDLGNVPASAKKFAEYLRGIETTSKETGDQLKKLGDGIDRTSEKMTKAGNSIKKSNQQWTSFALVIQDLPYGFRGIQNNLPALVGGIAGAAGPIYLIASALIAFTTAYEKEIASFIYGINAVDSAQQKLNVAISDGIGVAKAETATNAALLIVINDVNKSTTDRTEALDLLKEKYKGNIDLQKTDIDDGKSLIEITNKISEALLRKARAEAFSKLIAEEEAKIFKLQAEQGEQVVKNLGFLETSYQVLKSVGNVATTSLNVTTAAFNKQGKEITKAQGNVTLFTNKLNENTLAQVENNDAATLSTAAPKKDNRAKERLKAIENANDAETKAYITTLDERGKKEYEAGLLLADNLEKMKAAGYTNSITYYAAYRQKMLDIAKYYDDKEIKEQERISKEFISAFKSETKQQESDFNQFYKTKMDLATGDLGAQKEILLQQRAQLEEGLVLQAISWDTYTKGVGQNVKAVADISSKITKDAFDSLMNMGNGIMNALGPSLDMLLEKGASIGDVLTNAFQSVLRQLAKVIISAGIAVALLAILFPGMLAKAGGAGAVFKGLIGQGMGIGGLIGGGGTSKGVDATNGTNAINTIQSNSSAGQGGGNFVLKGQDLVLALNRSESSLKLRRG
jgi:hypothetical protein